MLLTKASSGTVTNYTAQLLWGHTLSSCSSPGKHPAEKKTQKNSRQQVLDLLEDFYVYLSLLLNQE